AYRRRQGSELEMVRELLDIARLPELRHPVHLSAGVFDEGDPAVFITHDQVHMPIVIEVKSDWRDHLQVHRQRLAGIAQATTGRVARSASRAFVLEVGEAVEKLAAYEVQVP